MAQWETFKLSELKLDQLNYRTGEQSSQRKAIEAIIEDQKLKLVNLAKDLLDQGPSPGEPIWVTRDRNSSGMYIVLEGNRRVCAFKLLENPALAHGTMVEDGFRILAKQFAAAPRRELEARVFSSRDEALPWIRRRHMTAASGVGLQGWKIMAKARANREHGLPFPRSLAVVEYLEDVSDEWANISDALDSRWTTVDRVLNAKALRDVLGVDIDAKKGINFENEDAEAGKRLLRAILRAMAATDFDFASVERVTDRESFLNRFLDLSVKKKLDAKREVKSDSSKDSDASGTEPRKPSGSKRPKSDQINRSSLAPKNGPRTFTVDGLRLSAIYRECRGIPLRNNENAASLLLRVFIELSSEAYLSEKKVALPPKALKQGKTDWSDIGISLATKVGCVVDHLDPSQKAKEFQQARVALNASASSSSSIETLHGYFHNRKMNPDVGLIREAWDAWEEYLRRLHSAR